LKICFVGLVDQPPSILSIILLVRSLYFIVFGFVVVCAMCAVSAVDKKFIGFMQERTGALQRKYSKCFILSYYTVALRRLLCLV